MAATVLGDADLTMLRTHFVKPQTAITMTFSDEPQTALTYDRFSGSATARLTMMSFAMQTASLR